MSYEIQMLIDAGVRDYAARTHLTLKGVPIDWEILKSQYKNIELGIADKQEYSLQQQLQYDYANVEGKKFLDELRDLVEFYVTDEIKREESENQAKEENRVRELNKLTEEKKILISRKAELTKECENKNKEFSSLSFFKFSEKRVIRQKLEQIAQELQEVEAKLSKVVQSIDYYEEAKPSEPQKEKYEDSPKLFSDEQLIVLLGVEKAKEFQRETKEDWEKRQYSKSLIKYRIIAIFRAILRAMTLEQIDSICQYYWSETYFPSKSLLKSSLRPLRLDGRITKSESGSTEYYVFQK